MRKIRLRHSNGGNPDRSASRRASARQPLSCRWTRHSLRDAIFEQNAYPCLKIGI